MIFEGFFLQFSCHFDGHTYQVAREKIGKVEEKDTK